MTTTTPLSERYHALELAFEVAIADVAQSLAAGVRPMGPDDLVRARARRRLMRTIAGDRRGVHHDLPAA